MFLYSIYCNMQSIKTLRRNSKIQIQSKPTTITSNLAEQTKEEETKKKRYRNDLFFPHTQFV